MHITWKKKITELRLKARTCNFGLLRDSLIRDQIVYGTGVDCDRSALFNETGLNLDKAITLCRSREATRMQMKVFRKNGNESATIEVPGDIGEINVVRRKAIVVNISHHKPLPPRVQLQVLFHHRVRFRMTVYGVEAITPGTNVLHMERRARIVMGVSFCNCVLRKDT